MFDKIQLRWDKELLSKPYPGVGKSASVTYILNSSGQVARITSVTGNAGKVGEEVCVTAITASAPYAKWPADMRAALGDEQELTITFYYQ